MIPSLKKLYNNLTELRIPNVTIYFSYETPIAFNFGGELYISENVWGVTTGKHLNMINGDKLIRIKNPIFNEMLTNTLQRNEVCVINDHMC